MLAITTITAAVALLLSNPIFQAILLIVGVYGWRRLIATDSIFERQRKWFYKQWPYEGFSVPISENPPKRGKFVNSGGFFYVTKGTFWGKLLECPYCLSWWIAIAQFGLYLVWPTAILLLAFLHASRIVCGILTHHFG